ncbi:MAG: Ig-like domain-containing protein [Candidatus Asgardarchaeia archaeon]
MFPRGGYRKEDETSGIKEVFVVYSENKADWNNVTASLSDSKYVAYIPEQSRETTLYVYILAVDNSGNVKYDDNNGEYYVTYVILPNVTCKIISPENNSIVRDTVSIVVTLRALAIKNASLLIENEIAMAWFYSGNYSYSWNTTGLSDGRYKIELVLYTIDGEVYSDTITLLIDRHPPMLEDLTYPAEVNVGDNIIINITARDEISGIKGIYVLYTINDGIWINVTNKDKFQI